MENKFIQGVRIYQPHQNAPSFVKGNGVFTVSEIVPFLQGNHVNDKVRFQVKESRNGGLYLELDTYIPKKDLDIKEIKENINETLKGNELDYPEEEINPEDIPF